MSETTKRKRYSTEKKAEVVNWVNDYNAKNGRGGVANASKHFDVTQLTISNWEKKAGGGKRGKVTKVANPGALRELADLVEQIAVKEDELKTMQKRYNALAKKI